MAGIGIRPLGEDDPKRLGPYRLLWRLTTGGMGRIYLARSRPDGPLVAVKTLLAEGIVSEPDRKRFAREMELAQRVDSAYTARVLDADARAERPWMAIEYVPAPSLGDLVREAGPLPAPMLPWIAAGAAQALLALHGKNVVHRDVKPQNILLPLTGPLLIDFGISHAFDKTTTSLTLGTIDYTSPEQAYGEHSTPASDVFSLGATLFHLAVGRAPYPETDDGPLQRLARVQAGRLDLDGLPRDLEPLILPCLSMDPGERPTLDDLLVRFVETAEPVPDSDRTTRRLPVRWTALIDAYEAHGRALGRDRSAVDAMTDEHTRPVPPPLPTLVDSQEREARRERERLAAEARERRERELREAAEAARRARAEEAAAEAERKAAEREKRERAAAAVASSPAGSSATPAGPPKSGSSSAGSWIVATVLVLALLIWHPWQNHHDTSGTTSGAASTWSDTPTDTSSDVSAGSSSGSGSGSGSDSGGDPATTAADTSTDGGSDTETSSGSDAYTDTEPPTMTPAPDPTEDAFKAVTAGDCLPVYDTGRGGSTVDWSTDVPPQPVSCGSTQWAGLLRVTSTTSSVCPSGEGQTWWSYTSASSGDSTKLCLSRIYIKHYCLLGQQSGNSTSIGELTAVDCHATSVPAPYNQVMWISGVYQAPPGANADNCVQSQSDHTRYWAWLVDGGQALLCTTIFHS
jgi:serine/threonine protein kinase